MQAVVIHVRLTWDFFGFLPPSSLPAIVIIEFTELGSPHVDAKVKVGLLLGSGAWMTLAMAGAV